MKMRRKTRKLQKIKARGSSLTMHYDTTRVAGQILTQETTQTAPRLTFPTKANTLYTIVMYDPDAPNPSWLHWLLVNRTSSRTGDVCVPYRGPSPPSGTHKYIFAVFEQSGMVECPDIVERAGFDIDAFARSAVLIPKYQQYFYVSARE